MKSRVWFIFLLYICAFEFASSTSPDHLESAQDNAIPSHAKASEVDHKLLHECANADYRAYIKCLKREKRQQQRNGTRSCLDECFEQNCTTSSCLRECHSHCRKRLIETYTKTIETSFDCANGDCHDNKGIVPNITTNIHIENILPNKTGGFVEGENVKTKGRSHNGEDGQSGQNGTSSIVIPKIDINNIITNQYGSGPYSPLPGSTPGSSPGSPPGSWPGPFPGSYPGSDCSCPGCNCNPYASPWQSMPQITIGIGGGPVGGCMFPSWPCMQKFPSPPADCSICINPFLKYACDPRCSVYDPQKNNTQTTTQKSSDPSTQQSYQPYYPQGRF